MVSLAIRCCFSTGIAAIVLMLCKRSANLMIRTRKSLAIATSILRIVAACCSSFESNCRRSSLVTPSTIAATSLPKSFSTSAIVSSVSSTASWRSAAATVVSSRPISATILATARGWLMYPSPLLRVWLEWACLATSKALMIKVVEAFGWRRRKDCRTGLTSSTAEFICRRQGRSLVTVAIV
ncbi:unannotated protein [freshwater metagenome]|uniref:Unannotated protein n=1 Tax=freshwater metagenome TaxID=449393 RepID=A0A6J6J1G4_9ZZZZ